MRTRQERPTPKTDRIFSEEIHDLWLACQERRTWRRSTCAPVMYRIYPLHPVLRCHRCGCDYHGQFHKGQRFSQHMNTHAGCPRPYRIRSADLEGTMIELLSQYQLPRNWRSAIQKIVTGTTTRSDDTQEHQRCKQAIDRLRKHHMWGYINDKQFHDEMRPLLAQIGRARPASTTMDSYHKCAEALKTIGSLVGAMSRRSSNEAQTLLREFFETAFSTIEVDGRQIVAIAPKPQYAGLFALGLAPQIVRTGALDWTRTSTPVIGN